MPLLESSGTPTFNGDSSCTIDSTDLLRAQTWLLNQTTGWFAGRVKPSWASGTPPANNPRVFDAGGFQFFYSAADLKWRIDYGANSVLFTNAHAAGDTLTVVSAWEPSVQKIAVNGSVFTTAVRPADVAVTEFSVGNRVGADRPFTGDYFWAAAGTGTLTDADSTTLNGFGNTDPAFSSLPGNPTFLWYATDLSFVTRSIARPPHRMPLGV